MVIGSWNAKERLTRQSVLTIPNGLSLFRILLIPVIVWLYVGRGRHYAAVAVVAVSGLTDMADGYIARRFHMVSDLGKVLDPVADKLTQAAILISLASRYSALWWVFGLLCVKELIQAALGYGAVRVTGQMQGARWYGKVSTGVFYATMMLLLLLPGMAPVWANTLMLLCAAALMMAMVLYVRYYLNLIWGIMFRGKARHSRRMQVFMLLMWAAVLLFCWLHRDAVTVGEVLRVTPRSTVLAVLLMLGLFVLKSLSVVIYCGFLYAVSGILFPLPLAIAVNVMGTAVMAAVPYLMGRQMGSRALEEYVAAHKNAALLPRLRPENTFVFAMLLRFVKLLPLDITSAYFGVTAAPLAPYLAGSILGMTVSMVLLPVLGANVIHPASPQFLIPAAAEVVCTGLSLFVLAHLRRNTPEHSETPAAVSSAAGEK